MAHWDAREGEVKGKLAIWVGSQYTSHYLGTWCIQHYYRWCAHLGCQQSTELTPTADLNAVGSQYPSHYLGTWCIQHYYRWCAHLGCQQSTELTRPARFKWTRPFRRKTKSGFCACAITFQLASTLFKTSIRSTNQSATKERRGLIWFKRNFIKKRQYVANTAL